jgi:hypothetical protein
MHEFGHVLGIFDAYAYEYGSSIFCPGVSDNELIGWDSTKTDVMRSSSDVTNLHAKMLLFAWSRNALQMYKHAAIAILANNEVSPALTIY